MAKSRSPEPTYFLDENLASAELEARLVAHGMTCVRIASMLISAHGRLVARLAKLRRPVFVDLYANGTCKITGDRRGAPPKTE